MYPHISRINVLSFSYTVLIDFQNQISFIISCLHDLLVPIPLQVMIESEEIEVIRKDYFGNKW